ncbi:hypothetical protein BU15DRAFT_89003 [Melanogaster broomeanus]|nr:hypothetical protein BU15DRAFT_89003 [Melanogaster broomeanus]
MHLEHVTAHPPDSVLFPFLHGLEGDNDAQCMTLLGRVVRPPRYRGLVWVLCDEDFEDVAGTGIGNATGWDGDGEYDTDSDDEFSSSEGEREVDGDVDVEMSPQDANGSAGDLDAMDVDSTHVDPPHPHQPHAHPHPMHGQHMHPTTLSISTADYDTNTKISLPFPSAPLGLPYSANPVNPSLNLTQAQTFHDRSPSNASPTQNPESHSVPAPSLTTKRASSTPPILTCTFLPSQLIQPCPPPRAYDFNGWKADLDWEFKPAKVPEGISLRNFGIQVPLYTSISDIVIYSPKGASPAALRLAERFKKAIERKRRERRRGGLRARFLVWGVTAARTARLHLGTIDSDLENDGVEDPHTTREGFLKYGVYVLDAGAERVEQELSWMVMKKEGECEGGCEHTEGGKGMGYGRIASELEVEGEMDAAAAEEHHSHAFDYNPNTRRRHRCRWANTVDFPQREKDEMRDLTRASEIVSVLGVNADDEEKDQVIPPGSTTATHWNPYVGQVFLGNASDVPLWTPPSKRSGLTPLLSTPPRNDPSHGLGFDICIECHEFAPLPSAAHLRAAEEHVRALEVEWVECSPSGTIPPRPPPHPSSIIHLPFPSSPQGSPAGLNLLIPVIRFLERVVTPGGGRSGSHTPHPASNGYADDSDDMDTNGHGVTYPPPSYRPRPLKVLLYSSDGYTESSVPALSLLMAVKGLGLPEAYLELQVTKRRSFFVYQSEVGLLKRVAARLGVANGSYRSRHNTFGYGEIPRGLAPAVMPAPTGTPPMVVPSQSRGPGSDGQGGIRPLTLSIPSSSSVPTGAMSFVSGSAGSLKTLPNGSGRGSVLRRPRASTMPTLISDHQRWFDDARFDGSFPSRVLPFLYLGNLNHASNAYMLHALGITHVVSVGECALVPPPQTPTTPPSQSSPSQTSSLWIEEREGRIKVLDIKGVCDDGIDTLEPQLHPICTWIEKARLSGGQVLVHCRVGVSRSATVAIAYVMQHLGLSLVEAYLVVRSRRLSVLIQPNMRLLYNLLGWEVRLARERAAGDERKLREELTRALSWPYLAREVHALNEKYLS